MKKYKDYFIVGGVSTAILLILFLFLGIYPFGNNTVLTGDLYTQVSALFYHLWDVFLGNGSLLVDYTSGGGESFFGIFSYYLVSPINFIVLFFKRSDIYLAISLVVMIKMVLSAITCLYSLKYLFKKDNKMFIFLALLYAFSGYSLINYQITAWMDVVYMFPLIVVGLKKLINEDKPYMYGITLFLTICFSFYLAYMMIIFIFLLAFIYIKCNVSKKKQKKTMLSLGIFTILPMGMTMFISYPTLKQIFESARSNTSNSIFSNLLGCLFDKLNFFNISILLVTFTCLLIINRKGNEKFLKWYISALLILLIPYIVEPLNKVFHFMSYSFFPNRYGFILFYLLVLGASYFFSIKAIKIKIAVSDKILKIVSILGVILLTILYIVTFKLVYKDLEVAVYNITMIYAKKAFIILTLLSIVIFGINIGLNLFRNEKIYKTLMYIVIISNIMFNTFLYIGIRDYQGMIKGSYQALNNIENKDPGNYYKLKTEVSDMTDFVVNDGIASNYQAIDHFTSLVNRDSLVFYKKLGYSSFWTMIFSNGGTLFSDTILSNKYLFTDKDIDDEFYTLKSSKYGYNFYELNYDLNYLYLAKDNFNIDTNDTFTYQNKIYKSITSSSNLFNIYEANDIKGISRDEDGRVVIKSNDNYIKYDIKVGKKSILYLDLMKTLDESVKGELKNIALIYINDELYSDSYPTKTSNGTYNLGVYENEDVSVKIQLIKPIDISKLSVATMSVSKYEDFVKNSKFDYSVLFDKNKIKIEATVKEDGYLVIPVSYSDNYSVIVNGENSDIVKMFGGILGVKVEKGQNSITYTYHNKDLEKGLIISLVATIVFILMGFGYKKISSNKILGDFAYYTYSSLFVGVMVLYVGIILVWLVKFII